MSGVPRTPLTPGRDRARQRRSSSSVPVGHGQGPLAGPQGAAGRVVGGDHHQPAVLVEHRGRAGPAGRRLGDRLGPAGPGLEHGPVPLIQH
jgi:hypothetical protein